jgi:hypothetical protein
MTNRLRSQLDESSVAGQDRHYVAYSLRHCFKQMLRTSNLDTELANRILGHSSKFVGE